MILNRIRIHGEGVKYLKKIVGSVILLVLVLAGCNSSTLSFSKIERVPHHVQDKVNPDFKLQSLNVSGKGYYIVFHSSGDVEGDVETQGETLTIKFNETNLQAEDLKQHTFYLTTDPEKHKYIDVLVNGELMPFDNVTVKH